MRYVNQQERIKFIREKDALEKAKLTQLGTSLIDY